MTLTFLVTFLKVFSMLAVGSELVKPFDTFLFLSG
jgi:hypothetical protein